MAIYRHYPDRAALLNSLADEGFEELVARLAGKRFSGGVEERLTKMGEVFSRAQLCRSKNRMI